MPLTRTRDWKLPAQLRVRGAMAPILAPDEPGTALAFLDILIDDCYGLRGLRRRVERIVDIGAHAGFFSLHAKMLFPSATVHAYEPNPALAPYLSQQAKTGGFQWFGEAVAETSGGMNLTVDSDSVQSRAMPLADRNVCPTDQAVPCVAFATALERIGGKIDFLKMDCEGGEWSIFRDARSFQAVRGLGMEYHLFDGHTLAELTDTVRAMGFTIHFMHADGPQYGRLWAGR
ncbi:MAG TPA: FkbM family methyltransferase [Planctomycetota bacterium]|nr:FkbM family methyltransferase [Planctomycetota bacterium]